MCAIFGVIKNGVLDKDQLLSMSRILRHRGPNDEGFVFFSKNQDVRIYGGIDTPIKTTADNGIRWMPIERLNQIDLKLHDGLFLGHRRLSVIDTSLLGHQPMSSVDGRFWISYNGEVYNYREIRSELERLGYRFLGCTDTEVILAAYQEWGVKSLDRFIGMWAFAIYDHLRKQLFLARDRFGIKPLYIWENSDTFAFASEIKAFTKLHGWSAVGENQKIIEFAAWSLLDHSEKTFFQNVYQIRAGHYAVINLAETFLSAARPRAMINQWYSLVDVVSSTSTNAMDVQLKDLLEESVRLQLRSDVPIGSCLSGGLDSSSIVCLIGEINRQNGQDNCLVNTFTSRSINPALDEYNFAQEVNRKYKFISHTVFPGSAGLLEEMEAVAWHQDEPFLSTSVYAQWRVFKCAKELGVTVMLDGQGADEVLGGYNGFIGAYLASLISKKRFRTWLMEVLLLREKRNISPFKALGYTLGYLNPVLGGKLSFFNTKDFTNLSWLTPAGKDSAHHYSTAVTGGRGRSVEEMSIAQTTSTNLPMLLHWEDRNSMAHSIEARVPFLDHRLVEHCVKIPDALKISGSMSKMPLRQTMRGIVPDVVLNRRDKLGFATSEETWLFRENPSAFREQLKNSVDQFPKIISGKLVDHFDQVVDGTRKFDSRYWRVICLGRWAKSFSVVV